MVNQPIRNRASRSNEDSQKSAYNSLIIGPRGLQCETNL